MGELYDRVYDFENLYEAYRLTARGKRTDPEKLAFEMNLGSNLAELSQRLEERTYYPEGHRCFMVYEPKQRLIHASAFPDRIVQHSLCDNVLREYLDPRLVYDCAACRKGKGTHFAIRRLTGFLTDFYKHHGTDGYFLKIDIRKYFDNIDHEILKGLFKDFPDEDVRELICRIIDSYETEEGKGLPLGNQSSQWFALYYLDRIDREIKEKLRIRYYTRYMDDMVLIHESKTWLKEVLRRLECIAREERKLSFNEKTQVFPLSQGADYLGWHFYLTDTGKVIRKLRTGSKRRLKKRIKAYKKGYAEGSREFSGIVSGIVSTEAHLAHGHTYALRRKIHSELRFHRLPQEE